MRALRRLGIVAAFALLGACATGGPGTARLEILPGGKAVLGGSAGPMRIDNHGPGAVEVVGTREGGDVFAELPLAAHGYWEGDFDGRSHIEIKNTSESVAALTVTGFGD
ncbi:MAG: hypothetical protein R3F20_18935 [Planctomycetota bacterium]